MVGSGAYGKVFLSHSIQDPSFKVAIKVLNKERYWKDLAMINEEVSILTRLDHPNIVKYYECYNDVKYMYLIMEYCEGGEIFKTCSKTKNQQFSEKEACNVIVKLVSAVNHCHVNGVMHRDIKPANIMFG